MDHALSSSAAPDAGQKELNRQNWALTAYARSLTALIRGGGLLEVMSKVCEAVTQDGAYRLALVGLLDDSPDRRLQIAAVAGEGAGYADGLNISASDTVPEGEGPTGRAIRLGTSVILRDSETQADFAPWRARAARFGIRSSVTVPFKRGERVIGALNVYAGPPEAFSANELAVFQKLADELAFATELDDAAKARKQTDDARHAADARYRQMFESSPDPIIIADWDEGILDVNPAGCLLSGYRREELIGLRLVNFLDDAGRAKVDVAMNRLRAGVTLRGETSVPNRAGEVIDITYSTSVTPDGYTMTVIHDVTASKAAEAARVKAEATQKEADGRYRRLFEHFRDGILVCDRETRIIDMNPSLCRKLQCEVGDLVGRRFFDLMGQSDWSKIGPRLATLKVTDSFSGEATLRSRDGTAFPIEYSSTVMPDGNILTIGRDITERRTMDAARHAAEQTLRDTQAELARFARIAALGEMVATISHEINQPLSAIQTYSAAAVRWLARTPPDLGEAEAALQRIASETERATQVVRRIRSFHARGEIQYLEFDLEEAIIEVLALTRVEQQTAGLQVETALSPHGAMVLGDRIQVQQVLINLVLNAIDAMRARKEGPRVLTLRSTAMRPGKVRVEVQDTGIGFPPATADKLFEPYFTTRVGGTGLGLAISRSIIEAHGGRIWAEPAPHGGAIFRFTLPKGKAKRQVHQGGDAAPT